jgi:hypothetical protein
MIAIDIKPGTEPNEINAKAKGAIPVAILSSATFDTTTVDASSLRFAGAGVSVGRGKNCCAIRMTSAVVLTAVLTD